MKVKSLIVIGFLMACMICPAVFAQEDYSKYEIFLGYSLLRVDEYDDMDDVQEAWSTYGRLKRSRFLEKGFSTSFTYNFASSVGLETSLRFNTGYILSEVESDLGVRWEGGFKRTNFALLAGPRFTFRSIFGSVTPFVYGLAGLSRDSVAEAMDVDDLYYGRDSNSVNIDSHNSLGFAVGVGLDIPVHDNVSIRAIQADYYRASHLARLADYYQTNDAAQSANSDSKTKPFSNVNLSFGVVIRFDK